TLRLDAVQIQIDGRPATHYIYSFKELDALRRGGVQRIYSGNIATGAHEIEVSLSAKLANGKDYAQTERFPFTKDIKPTVLDEPELDSLQHHIRQADFSVGDFELRYRMHLRAGRAIRAVLEADVDQPVKNEAAFRLARIEFQKGQSEDALHALERIHGTVPEGINDDIEFLRANVYLALGRPADAVEVLRRLQGAESLKGFAAY